MNLSNFVTIQYLMYLLECNWSITLWVIFKKKFLNDRLKGSIKGTAYSELIVLVIIYYKDILEVQVNIMRKDQ